MPPDDAGTNAPQPDPHVVAALQQETARRLMDAAATHTAAAPITPLDTKAICMHTWFTCLVNAGFTEDQALYLVKD